MSLIPEIAYRTAPHANAPRRPQSAATRPESLIHLVRANGVG